ncbi:MAG: glycosyltransferase [Dysgonamonadaceae bacterium]|jgi:glycosyltransferase involved in cell wall biosynthesis|nr:glycosyltransferase [Dysgonamonadaceae bacterium]
MFFELSRTEIILLCVSGFFFLIQLFYLLVYYAEPLWYQKRKIRGNDFPAGTTPSVSVIVCSQNESENLKRFLPSILEQNYPQYEVIVINDGSTDESDEVLGILEKQYKHLYRTYIPEEAKHISRKKLAMTIGIKAARYDYLIFTEPPCELIGPDWIRSMSRNFSGDKTIVLGFSPLSKSTGLKTKFAAYDNLINGLQYLSLAIKNHPYRGVGRNMGYKKSHFFEHKGYAKFMHLRAGEDDLFINQIATPDNVAVEISEDSLATMHLDDFRIWEEIRLCQSTTQKFYKKGPVAFWRFESWSRVFFWSALLCLGICGWPQLFSPVVALGLFLIRSLTQILVINKAGKMLHVEHFYSTLLLFDFFQPVFDVYIAVCRLIRGEKDYIWRG